MHKIQMVDLRGQYNKIKEEIDDAIQEVINQSNFIKGKAVAEFEKKLADYLNVKHVISCANGTDALQLALMSLDLKPGDEVITSDFTFIATAEVIALLGLKPVFVDVDRDTFTINPQAIEEAISPRTKAIIPVHLFGQTADMDALLSLSKKYNLSIIEDTAQATGSEYKLNSGDIRKAGTIGDIGTTSFFPSKNLGCFGDGGAVYTNNDELAEKIRMIANHGSKIKYHNDIVGINSRLDTIQAAVLNCKLTYLEQYNSERRKAADLYDKKLKDIHWLEIPYRNPRSTHIFHQYTLKVEPEYRDNLKEYLSTKGIPSMVYYPLPLHNQKAFLQSKFDVSKLKNALFLSNSVLSLPMHTELTEKEIDFISNEIHTFFENLHKD